MTEPLDLEKLAELEKVATPGPWAWHHDAMYEQRVVAGMYAALKEEDRAFIAALRNAAPALIEAAERWEKRRFECQARKQALPEPADCDWPFCGCDPYADKVFEALQECNKTLIDESELAALRAALDTAEKALGVYANPDLYKPHPHGPAFDDRDKSHIARTALAQIKKVKGA
jgi:hypothetical protein